MLETLLLEPTNRVDHRARSVAWKAAKRQHAAMREQAAELTVADTPMILFKGNTAVTSRGMSVAK